MNDGDRLFDALDGILDTADWKMGAVDIKYKDNYAFYMQTTAHNVRTLRVALSELAQHFRNTRYSVSELETQDIIDNLIDEYSTEIRRYKLPERG